MVKKLFWMQIVINIIIIIRNIFLIIDSNINTVKIEYSVLIIVSMVLCAILNYQYIQHLNKQDVLNKV